MTRVLYIQDRYPVLSQTFVTSEVEQLRGSGVSVAVATSRLPVSLDLGHDTPPTTISSSKFGLLSAHLRVLRSHPRAYRRYLLDLVRAPLRDMPFILVAPAIVCALSGKISHVHTHFAFRSASVARATASLLDVPRSVTTHANDIFAGGSRRWKRQLKYRLGNSAVLTISEYNRSFLQGLGISSQVNRCGIDSTKFEDFYATQRSTDVIFVGRFVAKKNPMAVLEALKSAKDGGIPVRAVMVGDGPLLAECRQFAAKSGLDVAFMGAKSREDTLLAMASARVLVLPCTRAADGDLDGIPIVLMEAMAMGTLVLSTRVSGIPELVQDGCGILLDEAAPTADLGQALLAAITQLLHEPSAEQSSRRARAREVVSTEFSLAEQAEGVARTARRSQAVASGRSSGVGRATTGGM